MAYPVEGASVTPEGTTNPAVLLPPPGFTNPPPDFRGGRFPRGMCRMAARILEPTDPLEPMNRQFGPPPGGPDFRPRPEDTGPGGGPRGNRPPDTGPMDTGNRPRLPFWARALGVKRGRVSFTDQEAGIARTGARDFHGRFRATCVDDIWLRAVIISSPAFPPSARAGLGQFGQNVGTSDPSRARQ